MAKKRIDVTSMSAGIAGSLTGGSYYAVAKDDRGNQVAYAYGQSTQEAKAKVVKEVRRIYPDAEILD
jgi:hypothetical protein